MATVTGQTEKEKSEMLQERLRLRKALRCSLSKACKGNPGSASDIAVARDKAERLFAEDGVIHELMISLGEDGAFESDFEKSEEYRELFLKFSNVHVKDELETTNVDNVKKAVQLPALKLPSFNGDPKHWVNFWAGFESVHLDEQLSDGQKLQYLRQCVSEEARTVVFSFPPSKENYEKVINHLKQRFGRKDLLINIYVRELINIVLTKQSRKLTNYTTT